MYEANYYAGVVSYPMVLAHSANMQVSSRRPRSPNTTHSAIISHSGIADDIIMYTCWWS